MSKFNEIFAYWDDKDKAKSFLNKRNFKRHAKPSPNNSNNNNNNQNQQHPPQQIVQLTKESDNLTTTTTTTVTVSVKVENTVTSNNNRYDNIDSTISKSEVFNVDEASINNNSSVNKYDNVLNQEIENKLILSVPSNSRYDNVSNNNNNDSQAETQSTSSTNKYDNVSSNTAETSLTQSTSSNSRYDNVSNNTKLVESFESTTSSARYDNQQIETVDNISNSAINNTSSSNYSAYNSYNTNNSNNNNNNNSYAATSSNYSSSYGVGSSSYSVYNVYSESGEKDQDFENEYSDEYSDEEDNNKGGKKQYIERDIDEEDLCLLENLIKYKARLGMEDENEIHVPNQLLSKKEAQEETSGTGYEEEDDNLLSNPYISNHTTFTSSYSHPKFLTEKGLQEGFSSRTIVQSSASAISNASANKIKLENISVTSWNSEFQRLLEMDDCLEKFERLSSLEHDFVYAAETYGRIIISENFLSNELKTIKPVSVGGIAGGEKYIVQGILFKFALENETFGLYGSDENAMKTAAHELNGCTSFLNCGIKGLHVPLMAYIDYRGFRLMAMSLLPISRKSLVYGSCDAGQTVHTSNNIFNHLFSNAAKIVNLKSHMVQDSSGDIKSIYGPIDIEGHVGTDNRFYLLDFARISPPEPVRHRGSYLYKLLRLELVRKFSKPLCSDAFSPMSHIEVDIHNSEVRECYDELLNTIIPNFAFNLENVLLKKDAFGGSYYILEQLFGYFKNISKYFHMEGINMRYLGEVRSYVTSDLYKDFLTVEAIVRTLKSLARELLRREMKKTHLPSDYPYRNLLLNFLNLIFDEYKGQTELFWTKIVFEKMGKKFINIFCNRGLGKFEEISEEKKQVVGPDGESTMEIEKGRIIFANRYISEQKYNRYNVEQHGPEIFKEILDDKTLRFKILTKFCKSIGLVLSKVSKNQFKESTKSFVFVDPDIIEIKTLITRLNIIDYADGMSLYYKSMAHGLNEASKNRLLTISKTRLEESLHSMSTNYNSIFQMGNVIRLTAKYLRDSSERSKKLKEAEKTFLQLENLRIDQNLLLQSRIHRCKTNISLVNVEHFDATKFQAVEKLIKDCIELSPSKAYPSYLLAKFYYNYEKRFNEINFERVTQAFENIFLIDDNYQKGHIAYSIFLLNTQKLNPKFSADKVSSEIIKAFSSGNIESMIEKIEPIINYNPWIVYQSSKTIPKVKKMVKKAFEIIYETKGNLAIPKSVVISSDDKDYFENIKLSKLYLQEQENSETVNVLLSLYPETERINLRGSSLYNSLSIFNTLKFCSNITSINLGKSKGILDDYIVTIISPVLKKIKLYEIKEISSITIDKIIEVAKDLELLDVGGCDSIQNESMVKLLKNNKNIKKIAFPPSMTNEQLLEIFNLSPQLVRVDLMKCSQLTKESFSFCFKLLPNLVKFRDPYGVPHFNINPQYLVSRCSTFVQTDPLVRYSLKDVNPNVELFSVKAYQSRNISEGKIFELFYNNNHPLVHFRDAPHIGVSGLFKVSQANFAEKPSSTLTVFKNPTMSYHFATQDFILQCFNNNSPIQNFGFDYFNVRYQLSLNHSVSVQGKTFNTNLMLGVKTILNVTNTKSMGMNVDLDIKDKISPMLIFLVLGFSYRK